VGSGELGLEPDRRAEFGDCASSFPWVSARAKVLVGIGIIGLKTDRIPVSSDRLLELPLVFHCVAEFVMGLRVVGRGADGRAIGAPSTP